MRDNKPSRIASRSEKVGKKRKANMVYNILLGVVILAIIIVGATIFLGDDEKDQASPKVSDQSQQEKEQKDGQNEEDQNNEEELDANDESSIDDEEDAEQNADDENTEEDSTEEPTEVENSGDPNVERTLVNESWEPVGTTQPSGEHVADYTKGSTDWNEMEQALAYGSGVEHSNMTVWFLGNGGSPTKAVGTVGPKDRSATYRVYIEWVDEGGWKPVKVEQLKTNDKAR